MNRNVFLNAEPPVHIWHFVDDRHMQRIVPHFKLEVTEFVKNESGTKNFFTADVTNTDTDRILMPSQFCDTQQEAMELCDNIYRDKLNEQVDVSVEVHYPDDPPPYDRGAEES